MNSPATIFLIVMSSEQPAPGQRCACQLSSELAVPRQLSWWNAVRSPPRDGGVPAKPVAVNRLAPDSRSAGREIDIALSGIDDFSDCEGWRGDEAGAVPERGNV